MSDMPREYCIADKTQKVKKKVKGGRRVASDSIDGSSRPTMSNLLVEPHDERGSYQAATPVANSFVGVS